MWIILSAIIIPPLGLLLLNLLNRRRKPNLSGPLVEELRQGLPHYEVESIEGKDSGVIVVKHAFGTWFIHAIELSRSAMLYVLKPPEYPDDEGGVVYPDATIKRVVDSRKEARRLGQEMVRTMRNSNDALRTVMAFDKCPNYS